MPYVSHKTPKIEKDVLYRLKELNDFKITEIKQRENLLVMKKEWRINLNELYPF